MTEEAPHDHKSLKRALRYTLTPLCIALIAFLAYRQPQVFARLLELDPWVFTVTAILLAVYFAIYSLRLQLALEAWTRKSVQRLHFFQLVILGRLFNTLVPQMGLIYRGLILKRSYDIKHSDYIGSQISFAAIDLIINTGTFITIWMIYERNLPLGIIAAAVYALVIKGLFTLIKKLPLPDQSQDKKILPSVRKLQEQCEDLAKASFYIPFIACSLTSLVIMSAVFSLYFDHLGNPLSIPVIVLFYTLYRMTFYLTITPGNIGLREIALGALGTAFSVPVATASLVALTIRVQSYIVLAAVGIPLFLYKRKQISAESTRLSNSPSQ
jgi:uncharacterized membrane protein YbhN (UPF0104 family)